MSGYLFDTHIHTSESSSCGQVAAADVVARYKSLGYRGIIITDHMQHIIDRFGGTYEENVDRFLDGYHAAKALADEILEEGAKAEREREELKAKLATVEGTIEEAKEAKDDRTRKMQLGKARSDLNRLITNTQVRALVTIDKKSEDSELVKICDTILEFVDVAKGVDLSEKDINEINELKENFKALCKSVGGDKMVNLPKDVVEKATLTVRKLDVTLTKKTTQSKKYPTITLL